MTDEVLDTGDDEQVDTAAVDGKLAAVQAIVDATVGKDARNKDQGFDYSSAAAVARAVKPALAAEACSFRYTGCEVISHDPVTSRLGAEGTRWRLLVGYRFAGGGGHIDVTLPMEAVDYSDKGLSKILTQAQKYAALQMFYATPGSAEEVDAAAPEFRSGPAQTHYAKPTRMHRLKATLILLAASHPDLTEQLGGSDGWLARRGMPTVVDPDRLDELGGPRWTNDQADALEALICDLETGGDGTAHGLTPPAEPAPDFVDVNVGEELAAPDDDGVVHEKHVIAPIGAPPTGEDLTRPFTDDEAEEATA